VEVKDRCVSGAMVLIDGSLTIFEDGFGSASLMAPSSGQNSDGRSDMRQRLKQNKLPKLSRVI
jgi:hypothetical protein